MNPDVPETFEFLWGDQRVKIRTPMVDLSQPTHSIGSEPCGCDKREVYE